MPRKDLAYITPALLTWAIERSNLNRAEIARKLHLQPNILEAYERGLHYPLFNKALEMSKVLQVPFGYFFLTKPPSDEIPIPDLRTLSGTKITKPSPDFLEVLYQALSQHDWYKAYLKDEEAEPLPFTFRFTINSDIKEVANDIATRLGVNQALRREAGSWGNYLTKLSQRAEKAGIIVLRRAVVGSSRRKLSRDEFQGFAVFHPVAPFVFINGQDYDSAKIFTLIHELAHIWIGQSGISKADEVPSVEDMRAVERFCNSVAVEVLVPTEEFINKWDETYPDFDNINRLARHFLVSALVIVRRAKELNQINFPTFVQFLEEARKRMKPKAKPKQQDSGGNFYNNLDARNSPTLVEAIATDVKRDGTLINDAAKLLSVKPPTIVKMMESRIP